MQTGQDNATKGIYANLAPKWSIRYLSKNEIFELESLIESIEAKTSAEVVVVIKQSSTSLKLLPVVLALMTWVLFSGLEISSRLENLYGYSLVWSLAILFISLVLGTVLAKLPGWHRWLQSSEEIQKGTWNCAIQEFYLSKIQATEKGTGILIFVSLFERRVVVLADKAIAAKKNPETWDNLVAQVTDGIRKGSVATGLKIGLKEAGEILASHFPPGIRNKNELPNAIVFRN